MLIHTRLGLITCATLSEVLQKYMATRRWSDDWWW